MQTLWKQNSEYSFNWQPSLLVLQQLEDPNCDQLLSWWHGRRLVVCLSLSKEMNLLRRWTEADPLNIMPSSPENLTPLSHKCSLVKNISGPVKVLCYSIGFALHYKWASTEQCCVHGCIMFVINMTLESSYFRCDMSSSITQTHMRRAWI